jgi:hypothetical protein
MLTGVILIVWEQAVSRPDQLLPYYVMDIAASIPGLPGLFVAGIFSAALRYVPPAHATSSGYILLCTEGQGPLCPSVSWFKSEKFLL